MRILRLALLTAAAVALTCNPALAQPAAEHPIARVSGESGRAEANNASFNPEISADGRWVAFASAASNLVPQDTNHRQDVFVRDTVTGVTTRVSVSSTGRQGNLDSYSPAISDDGRFVVFDSFSSNLVPDDVNTFGDVFLHDREQRTTTRISLAPGGVEADGDSGFAVISGDGNVIAFESSAGNLDGATGTTEVFTFDRTTGTLERASRALGGGPANAGSGDTALSRDGGVVAFASSATNLVLGDLNLADDVFVLDRALGLTRRVSVNSVGGEANSDSGAPTLSADGEIVAFASLASSLTSLDPTPESAPKFLLGALAGGDTNFVADVFVHDLSTARTELVSLAGGGAQGSVDSIEPSISGDGRLVAFTSSAPDLVDGDNNEAPDVFLRDLTTRQTTQVSLSGSAGQTNGFSSAPAMSADGTRIAFISAATNLVRGDRNSELDVFVRS